MQVLATVLAFVVGGIAFATSQAINKVEVNTRNILLCVATVTGLMAGGFFLRGIL